MRCKLTYLSLGQEIRMGTTPLEGYATSSIYYDILFLYVSVCYLLELQAYERAQTIEQVEKFGVGVCIDSIILFLFFHPVYSTLFSSLSFLLSLFFLSFFLC